MNGVWDCHARPGPGPNKSHLPALIALESLPQRRKGKRTAGPAQLIITSDMALTTSHRAWGANRSAGRERTPWSGWSTRFPGMPQNDLWRDYGAADEHLFGRHICCGANLLRFAPGKASCPGHPGGAPPRSDSVARELMPSYFYTRHFCCNPRQIFDLTFRKCRVQ